MKLLRVGAKGAEKPAILHTDGTYRDLSSVVPDINGSTIGADLHRRYGVVGLRPGRQGTQGNRSPAAES